MFIVIYPTLYSPLNVFFIDSHVYEQGFYFEKNNGSSFQSFRLTSRVVQLSPKFARLFVATLSERLNILECKIFVSYLSS